MAVNLLSGREAASSNHPPYLSHAPTPFLPAEAEPEAASNNSTCPLIVLAPILEAAFEEATGLAAVIVESIAPALVTVAEGLSEPAYEEAVALSAESVANASIVLAEGLMEAVAEVYPGEHGEESLA